MALASDALDSARTYLNDVGKQFWSDTRLLPYLKEAFRDLLIELSLNGVPVIKERNAAQVVSAVAYTGIYNGTPKQLVLPADFIEPIKLKESTSPYSTTDPPDDMVEQEWEPDVAVSDTLRYWVFRGGSIDMIGATQDRTVVLFYTGTLTMITAANSALVFPYAETFLGPQAAGYAAGSRGNTSLAQNLLYTDEQHLGVAGSKLEKILMVAVKNQQNMPARRIPYHRARRVRVTSF